MSRWFRHYAGMCSDPKFGGIARRAKVSRDRVVFVFAFILEVASEANDNGAFHWDADAIADLLNCDTNEIERVHAEILAAGLIQNGRVAKWSSRQYEDRTNAERQARYKERKRAAGNAGNAPVTEPERVSNGPIDIDIDIDRDIDRKKKEQARERAAEFLVFWNAYPRKVARDGAAKAYLKAREKTDAATILAGLDRYKRHKPVYADWAHAASWLNAGRWADDYGDPKPSAASPDPDGPMAEDVILRFLRSHAESEWWPGGKVFDRIGPPPRKPGCRLPAHLIAAYDRMRAETDERLAG